jgi:uncharacterized protein YjiS (DUF1127 family)
MHTISRYGARYSAILWASWFFAGLCRWIARMLRDGVNQMLTWQARIDERQFLQTLDDRMLSDMGMSRADIAREIDKGFWQA